MCVTDRKFSSRRTTVPGCKRRASPLGVQLHNQQHRNRRARAGSFSVLACLLSVIVLLSIKGLIVKGYFLYWCKSIYGWREDDCKNLTYVQLLSVFNFKVIWYVCPIFLVIATIFRFWNNLRWTALANHVKMIFGLTARAHVHAGSSLTCTILKLIFSADLLHCRF